MNDTINYRFNPSTDVLLIINTIISLLTPFIMSMLTILTIFIKRIKKSSCLGNNIELSSESNNNLRKI